MSRHHDLRAAVERHRAKLPPHNAAENKGEIMGSEKDEGRGATIRAVAEKAMRKLFAEKVAAGEIVYVGGSLYRKADVPTATEARLNFDDHFGTCPDCGKTDGYINIGRSHWFYCAEHKTRWIAGSNLFSSWLEETREEQKARYEELEFGTFAYIAWTPEEARGYDEHYGGGQAANPTRVRAAA